MSRASKGPRRSADIDTFLSAFDAFAQAVRRARGARSAVDPDALTLTQYGLLEPLLDRDPSRVRELALKAGVTAPTATRVLDTLERRGLVTRAQAAGDRRGVSVSLTGRGRTALAARHDWLRSRERALYASLTDEERALSPQLLLRLTALIEELAAGPDLD
jgi:DNA-binding MarR family transcriptional regulator